MPRRFLPLLAVLITVPLGADEGMWLFNQVPRERLAKTYGFSITGEFLDHLRQAAARFGRGGSASFVSPHGLLFTNHHVGRDCIQKLSTPAADYMANGFYALSETEERTCPGLEVNTLLRMQDVTARVNAGGASGSSDAAANQQRRKNIAAIEKECAARSGNRCEVVTLYAGGRYDLYEYKKYTDVRLVFAPEYQMAVFGGDPDNFNYPRYGLDFAFFRAYESGRPARIEHYLKWSRAGAREGELALVAGHPGATGRLVTIDQLEFNRDVSFPLIVERLTAMVRAVERYGQSSPENLRASRALLRSVQNSLKSYTGQLRGLCRAELMDRKRHEEGVLRDAVEHDKELRRQYGEVWDELAAAYREYRQFFPAYYAFEQSAATGSELLRIGRNVLRLAEERAKPDGERLAEYTDARLPALEQTLFAAAPIVNSMETAVIAEYLRFLLAHAENDHAAVKAILAGRSPEDAAALYVASTKLADVPQRKRLAADRDAARGSDDGILRLARMLDGPARRYRKRYEDRVEAVMRGAGARIARARFAIHGAGEYPDATGTLRLTWGPVKGYGQTPWATTMEGLFRKATGEEPTRLPQRWIQAKPRLDLATPYDFVTTADIHGGNSGSPTVNRNGEIIGIVFDSNLESLPNTFLYTDAEARSIHVAAQAIVEALGRVYHADRVLAELGLPSEEQAVLAVVERLFDAMAARDTAAARAILIPEGRYFSVRDNGAISGATHEEFLARLGTGKEAMRERMWNSKVLIHGRIAMVWADYDFHRDGKFSHCGVDSFSLVKTAAGWKIAGFLYTVEPAGCAPSPLGPLR